MACSPSYLMHGRAQDLLAGAAAVFGALILAGLALRDGSVDPAPLAFVALILAAPLGLAAVFHGPAWAVTAVFLGCMSVMHLSKSVVIFPVAGIDLHPREILLGGYMAFAGIYFLRMRCRFRLDPMHLWFGLYAAFFLYIAIVGIALGNSLTGIIAEFRYAMFLAVYPLFVLLIASRRELYGHFALILGIATILAGLSLAFFAYTFLSGNVINEQNAYGEYVKRQIGPYLLQSVRPNGHYFFEIGVIVLASFLVMRRQSIHARALLLAWIGLFCAAILITMMRTAYISVAVSLGALAVLLLPRRMQFAAMPLLGGCALLTAALFWAGLSEAAAAWMGDADVSLKGRFVEIRGSLRELAASPILGTGMGSTFQEFGYVAETSELSYAQKEYQTLHNVWMYFLYKGGGAGFIMAAAAIAGMLAHAWRATAFLTGWENALMRGLLAAWVGQLIASLAMPRLTYPMGAVLMAFFAAAFCIVATSARGNTSGEGPG